jgi:hypothetical protein
MQSGRLKVEQLFGGTNYLEDLASTQVNKLRDKRYPGTPIVGSPESIFNKFTYFTYSNFINGLAYDPGKHFIGYENRDMATANAINDEEINRLQNENQQKKEFVENSLKQADALGEDASAERRKKLEEAASNNDKIATIKAAAQAYAARNESATLANPTASNLVNWGAGKSVHSVTGFQPYSLTDFVFCKYYGKIPNNRLITLRRYPFPIDDRIADGATEIARQPLPVCQAVTWWGGDTGNNLSNIGVMKWNLNWQSNTVQYQEITGNEVLVSDVLAIFDKLEGGSDVRKALEIAYTAAYGSNANLQQLSGIEKNMQAYLKGLYETNGPYWNRVFGPVNVIDRSLRRERGMQTGWDQEFSIKFHYSFRSFNGLSPKVVALDLISNFLHLTYADAQFLGQLNRYFANPGLKFSPTVGELIGNLLTRYAMSFETGDMTQLMKLAQTTVNTVKDLVGKGVDLVKGAIDGDTSAIGDTFARAAQATAMDALSKAVPKFISVKSALSDRPIGEWHLVVGNPMNPIMVMGDLVCSSASMQFDEDMGPDDFPTGVTFTVGLKQGKPRDKTAIERIFNLGQTKLTRSQIRNPSSTQDTMGTQNNADFANLKKALGPDGIKKVTEELGFTGDNTTESSFMAYRDRLRRAYRYAGSDKKDPKSVSSPFDDGLLWLYFERRQTNT